MSALKRRKIDESEVKLGEKYRDTITGFEGIATGRHEYLHGCTRITLMAERERDQARDALRLLLDATDSTHYIPGVNPDGSVSTDTMARTLARAALGGAAEEKT